MDNKEKSLLSSKCHNWWNRRNWYYPRPGWGIRVCKKCGQTQITDREDYQDCSYGEFEHMIKWADERDSDYKRWKEYGLEWLKENKVI